MDEQKIIDLINQILSQRGVQNMYNVSPVPFHTHNNIDSPYIATQPSTSTNSIFYGIVKSDGTAIILPDGWSSSRSSAGEYIVTHNLGTTSYGVVTNAVSQVSTHLPTPNSANFFQIFTTDSSGSVSDSNFTFILVTS